MKRIIWMIALLLGYGAQAQTLVFADFNTSLPTGWNIVNGGTTTDTWYRTTNLFNGNSLDGTQFMFVNSDAAGNSPSIILSEILETPTVNATPYTTVLLEFDHYYRDYSLDSGFVEVYNGSNWVRIAAYSSNQGNWGTPNHVTLNLTPHKNANMKVRFRYEDNAIWAWYWAVDNIRIHSPAPYDGKMAAILSPTTNCGLTASQPVTVSVTNTGTDTMDTYTLSYRMNGGAIVTQAGTVPVPPGDTIIHTFTVGANLSAGGIYTLSSWVTAPGDVVPTNDSVTGYTVRNYAMAPFPYFENFEGSTPGWFQEGTNSTWAFGTPAKDVIIGASSGTKAWVTGGLGTTNHLNNDDSWVSSRCLDLTNTQLPELSLRIWWNAEFSWDGAALQASTDLGATWATIGVNGEPDNWYNDDAIDGQPGGQAMGWTGRDLTSNGSGGWVTARHKVYGLSGSNKVIFRVAFASDGSVTDDGFAFDDFRIGESPYVNLGNDTIVCDNMLLNPGNWAGYAWSNGASTPTLLADTSGTYTVTVTDANGFTGTDEINLTVVATDQVHLGNDTLLCPGETLTLFAGAPAVAYLWSDGSTNSQLLAGSTGNFAVTVTYLGGCTGTDDLNITVSPLAADFVPGNDTVCRGEPIPFTQQATGATSYWWDFGDGDFSANPNPIHAFQSGGSFPVTLTVEDGNCTVSFTQWIFADICTGLIDGLTPEINAWPNPTQGAVWVEVPQNILPERVVLLDLAGKICRVWNWEGNAMQRLSLEGLSAGMYFVQMDAGQGKYLFRLVKE